MKHGLQGCLPYKIYNIPPTLVVNSDQIGIHLVPTIGDWTWETKGTKHIKVLGIFRIKTKSILSFHQMGCSSPFMSYLQVPQIEHCHQIMEVKPCALTMDGISPLVRITGQLWKPQKDLCTKYYCHFFTHNLNNWPCQNNIKWFGY